MDRIREEIKNRWAKKHLFIDFKNNHDAFSVFYIEILSLLILFFTI